MENLKEFTIKFVGLKDGLHVYEYKIGKKFFDAFEYSEIEEGEVAVIMKMEKATNMLVLNFSISGIIDVECDLCLDQLQLNIEGDFRQIVKFTDEDEDSRDEEIVFLPLCEFEINVASFIFEFIHLCIPTKKTHKEGECNEKVKSILNKYILTEGSKEGESEEIDPRWKALKELKNREE